MPIGKRRGRPKINELRNDRSNYIDKEFESKKRAKVYTTEVINQIFADIRQGKKTDMMPFFHGKTEWRNQGIIFEYTAEEWEEIQKCTMDPLYFIEKYCTFLTDYGRKTVTLRPYQKDVVHLICDEEYNERLDLVVPKNRRVILLQSRQTGKTTTTAATFCWYLCFHSDKNCMVVANKGNTAEEIIGKITEIFKHLPFFLKPGINSVSEDRLSFENGCSLRCAATSDTPTTGDTLHMLMIDECALIPANKINNFWASVFPTMSSSELSQIIVLSTPRGKHNLYYDLYSGAVNGTNGFVYKRVDYWEVPGHDTEEWKEKTIAAFGEALFNQEFGLSFEEDASKLVAPRDLKLMSRIKKDFKPVEIFGIPNNISEKIYWHPDFHPDELTKESLLTDRYLLQVDTAQGKQAGLKGQEDADWNIINIYRIEFMSPHKILQNRMGYKEVKIKDCIRFRQIGIYMDQDSNEEFAADAAKMIVFNLFKCGQQYMGEEIDNCRIMIEINFNGVNWIKKFMSHDMFYTSLIVKTLHSQKAKNPDYGFKTVGGSHGKGYWCEVGAKLIAARQIIVSQDNEIANKSTIQQLESFGKNKRGIYEGSCMHDDIAVTVLFLGICLEQDEFIHWIDDWYMTIRNYDISDEIKKKLTYIDSYIDEYTSTRSLENVADEEDIVNLYRTSSTGFNSVGGYNNSTGYYHNNSRAMNSHYMRQRTSYSTFSNNVQKGDNPFNRNNPFRR